MSENIKNANLLIDIFGRFPSFHDAEIIEISLLRRDENENFPKLTALIYVDNYSNNEKFVVKIIFKNISGLKLENFGHQNVIGELIISEFSDDFFTESKKDIRLQGVVGKAGIENLSHYVKFEYCFGVEAEFLCGEIVVDSVISYTEK